MAELSAQLAVLEGIRDKLAGKVRDLEWAAGPRWRALLNDGLTPKEILGYLQAQKKREGEGGEGKEEEGKEGKEGDEAAAGETKDDVKEKKVPRKLL